jgi:dihydroorotase-like cyclic amidohydrolase
MTKIYDRAIRGGFVVTATDVRRADVGIVAGRIVAGRIVAVGENLKCAPEIGAILIKGHDCPKFGVAYA